jgi:hypothetical protein
MLGTLENNKKYDWKAYIGPLVQAYNATKNDATGYALPFCDPRAFKGPVIISKLPLCRDHYFI